MLTSINVANDYNGYNIKFPLYKPSADLPYIITDVTGLGPVKAEMITSESVNSVGTLVQGTRVGARNIVMTIGYAPNRERSQTVQALRRDIYKYLSPESPVLLRVDDNENLYTLINGVVESAEPTLFGEDPKMVISIYCGDPYFRAPFTKAISNFSGNLIPLKGLSTGFSGFELELTASATVTGVRLQNFIDDDIVYSTDLASGHKLLISTNRGSKKVQLDTGSGYVNDLNGLTSGGLSMTIGPRVENFRVVVAGTSAPQLIALRFRQTFSGV